MANRIFLIGIVAGLAGALGLGALVSVLSTQTTAQMMGNTMTGASQISTQQAPWHWSNKASFSSSGVSNVPNVQVTGISISGDNEVSVSLRYRGNGTTANVVLIASTDPMSMAGGAGGMGMMGSGMPMMGQGMIQSGQYPAWNNTQWQQWHNQMAQWHGQTNDTQWEVMQAWHNQMMMNPGMTGMLSGQQMPMFGNSDGPAMPASWQQPLTGSAVLNAGWTSDTTVRVTLVGDGSAYDSNNVSVMVYPLTS